MSTTHASWRVACRVPTTSRHLLIGYQKGPVTAVSGPFAIPVSVGLPPRFARYLA